MPMPREEKVVVCRDCGTLARHIRLPGDEVWKCTFCIHLQTQAKKRTGILPALGERRDEKR